MCGRRFAVGVPRMPYLRGRRSLHTSGLACAVWSRFMA